MATQAHDAKLRELLDREESQRQKELARFSEAERQEFRHHWELWARSDQKPPAGDWTIWLVMAGRGFGKTRAGAEWVREMAKRDGEARIALVGASLNEVRSIMVEGESGILASSPPHRSPYFEPSLRRLTWPNGAQATLYSAGEPESLRGPQHSHAWCDEIAKWETSGERATRAWDNLLLGLRLGEQPRLVATTTPRSVPLVTRLMAEGPEGQVAVTRGSTRANKANLPERFLTDIERRYNGTSFARQEIGGELLTDIEGALWTRELIERCRQVAPAEPVVRTVIGVDPPASAHGDECGIVGTAASGAWETMDGKLAAFQSGTWLFADPNDGMRLFDRSTGQILLYLAGWHRPNAPTEPTGGSTIDAEARAAINDLIAALVDAGVFAGI